jgi:hypothetical protein
MRPRRPSRSDSGPVAICSKPQVSGYGVDFWHDRAALHFLTAPEAAQAYVRAATRAIVSGGHAVIGCFAADGPEKCSGLPVVRRDPADIAALFGQSFALVESRREVHSTPGGIQQRFAYALLRKY